MLTQLNGPMLRLPEGSKDKDHARHGLAEPTT